MDGIGASKADLQVEQRTQSSEHGIQFRASLGGEANADAVANSSALIRERLELLEILAAPI